MMIIPQYWADEKKTRIKGRRQVTFSRFGWSDLNQKDAQKVAHLRIAEAFRQLDDGEYPIKREERVAYNGSDGVPIREEVIKKFEDVIITRNPYGALCLNTTNVLFADIDYPMKLSILEEWGVGICAGLISFSSISYILFSFPVEFLALIFTIVFFFFLFVRISNNSESDKSKDNQKLLSMANIEAFSEDHPEWHVRIYSTPAGLRILAMHDIFTVDEAMEFFSMLGTDYMYMNMCRIQDCFRARVSPKPWRVGLTGDNVRIQPQGVLGLWPVESQHIEQRNHWINQYDAHCESFASCHFEKSLGSDTTHPKAEIVRKIHDEYCKAHSYLPIA